VWLAGGVFGGVVLPVFCEPVPRELTDRGLLLGELRPFLGELILSGGRLIAMQRGAHA